MDAWIDFSQIEQYRENNRIEAKKAVGGLPKSIWETYSAFANAFGGVILLGVEELPDHTLRPVDLPDPEGEIREFWAILNQPKRVSVNILTEQNVTVQTVDGKRTIAIYVPRAHRCDRPVYIDGDPMSGTYRRSGEGDYRCTPLEVDAMLRDAEIRSQDMEILETVELSALDGDSIWQYRAHLTVCRPGHAWEHLHEAEFLQRLGAIGRGSDGKLYPTAGGLLMFGKREQLRKCYPELVLRYGTDDAVQENAENVYAYYRAVSDALVADSWIPKDANGRVYGALLDVLVNSLTNADYHGTAALETLWDANGIRVTNPGSFRMDWETARSGGLSDPRNACLTKMFHLVDVGQCSGSGIPNLYRVWKEQGWAAPVMTEQLNPDRITMTLTWTSAAAEPMMPRSTPAAMQLQRAAVVNYLTERITASTAELAKLLGISNARVRRLLRTLMEDNIVIAVGEGRSRVYRLKA